METRYYEPQKKQVIMIEAIAAVNLAPRGTPLKRIFEPIMAKHGVKYSTLHGWLLKEGVIHQTKFCKKKRSKTPILDNYVSNIEFANHKETRQQKPYESGLTMEFSQKLAQLKKLVQELNNIL